jgi:periplasmic protein TonB
MANQDISKLSFYDLIFQGRNKSYGGYFLRQVYGKHIIRGTVTAIFLFGLGLAYLLIDEKLRGLLPKKGKLYMHKIELAPPPLFDKPIPPPPPLTNLPLRPPLPDKFVSPMVTVEEKYKDQNIIPPVIPDKVDIGIIHYHGCGDFLAYSVRVPPPPVEKKTEPPKEDNTIFQIVEQKPMFPDGDAALFKWLGQNLNYPTVAKENEIEGTVYVGFVVDKDGSITDVAVKRGLSGGCNEEAVRVVNMMPKWNPGKQQGRAVRVAYTLPIKFKLE